MYSIVRRQHHRRHSRHLIQNEPSYPEQYPPTAHFKMGWPYGSWWLVSSRQFDQHTFHCLCQNRCHRVAYPTSYISLFRGDSAHLRTASRREGNAHPGDSWAWFCRIHLFLHLHIIPTHATPTDRFLGWDENCEAASWAWLAKAWALLPTRHDRAQVEKSCRPAGEAIERDCLAARI